MMLAELPVSDAWMIVACLIAGAVCFLLEICTPSFGVLAFLGLASLAGAAVFGFRVNMFAGMMVILGCLLVTPVYLYVLVRLLPNTPLGRRLFLRAAPAADNTAVPESAALAALVGKTGTAESLLRPSGVIRIDGKRYDARAEHEMIEKGAAIRVLRAGGTDVVVTRVES
ncbi:MAG: hypothetical protein JW849_11150 [Phycisphaerae bacterium]|nr:hypothetical protein [Phycisphaerae bacterium]